MRKFNVWFFDTVCGIFLCEGLATIIWLVAYLIGRKPEFNAANLAYLTEVIALFWISGFIFRFNSPVLAKGILHSIICFMLSIILFSLNFGYVPAAIQLVMVMVVFFVIYAAALTGSVYLSKILNVPFRHITEWLYKLNSRQARKVIEEK